MNLATFKTLHPEFNGVDDSLLQAELDLAGAELSKDAWGARWDTGQRYLTAHRLALSPFGTGAQLVGPDGKTTYGTHYDRLVRSVTCGLGRVA